MPAYETILAPTEFKFVEGGGETGTFEGYGSVNHVLDSHGDVVMPEAFKDSLAGYKAAGRYPPMYAQHSRHLGGDLLPVGKWLHMEENEKGLYVKGKISALDSEHGKRIHALMKDDVLGGLSIVFSVADGGAVLNKKAGPGEAKRILNKLNLYALDVVDSPSNSAARVESMRSTFMTGDHPAVKSIIAAYRLHRSSTTGNDSPDKAEREALLKHLNDAHMALTGQALKSIPTTIRELEAFLRDEGGYSKSQASEIAAHGFKSATRRDDEGSDTATVDATKTVTDAFGAALDGFVLPKFK